MLNSRQVVVPGIVLAAVIAAVGLTVFYWDRANATATATDTEMGDSERVTVRLFKDPAAVSDFTVQTLDGRTLSRASISRDCRPSSGPRRSSG